MNLFIDEKNATLLPPIDGFLFLWLKPHYTQWNLFGILLNQTEIRLYLPCTDCFGTKRRSVLFQINRCMVNTICFRFHLIGFRKDFPVCAPCMCVCARVHTARDVTISRGEGDTSQNPPAIYCACYIIYWKNIMIYIL